MHRSHAVYVAVLLCVSVATVATVAQEAEVDQNAATKKLDEGLLDPSWFAGGETLEFHRTRLFDYFWVAEDLTLEGRQLQLDDWEVTRLPSERQQRDRDKAEQARPLAPELFLDTLEKVLKDGPRYSRTEGDVRVMGRFVDVNASRATAWKVGYFTFDLKLVDAETDELLVAVHHRMIGNPKPKLKAWFRGFAKMIQEDLRAAYAGAEVAVGPP
jgi:hypothetical protein